MTENNPTQPRRITVGNVLKYVIPLVISVGLCWLLFTGIDFDEMMTVIRQDCDFGWISLALCVSLLSYVFRALRWRLQLNALGIRTPLFYLVISVFGNYAVNLVFPRLGELWRSGYIAQRQHAPFTAVFGSMIAERLADTITVALITLLAFVLASGALISYFSDNAATLQTMESIIFSPWLLGAGVLCIGALWWLFKTKSKNRIILKLRTIIMELWKGFAVIVSMPKKWQWLMWTVCLWGCYFSTLLIAFLAFPATENVLHTAGVPAALVTFALTSISMGVPSNGGIGPWQWAAIFALGIYGVSSATAGAFANVVLGSQTLLQIVLGIFTFAMIALDKRKTNRKLADEPKE